MAYTSLLKISPGTHVDEIPTLPPNLEALIKDDQILGLYTPDPAVNTCFNNFSHCRSNQMFQPPFCLFCPLAAIGWVICLPYEVLFSQ